jgi:hypothetical protein
VKGVKTLFSAEIWFSADRRRWLGVQDLPANPDDRIYAPYGVTRVHMRSRATPFFLQIRLIWPLRICRETSRVSFLTCPFCVRASSSVLATQLSYVATTRPPA